MKFKGFADILLNRIFGSTRNEARGGLEKMRDNELDDS